MENHHERLCPFFLQELLLQILDVGTTGAVLSHGMSLLGYDDNYLMTANEAINFTHISQRALFAYQTAMVYRVFFRRTRID